MKTISIKNSSLNYEGFLSIDSINNGMAFGGCRFSLSVTEGEVQELARCMTMKLKPYGLPVGGAKGGLRVDPTSPKIREVIADFAQSLKAELSTCVVLGKDLGATDDLMDYLYACTGNAQLSPVLSKFSQKEIPRKIRDFKGYEKHMTGKGLAWATEAFYAGNLLGKSVAIQGAGAVGIGSAFRLGNLGAKVVAISDKNLCVSRPSGFTFEELLNFCQMGTILAEKLPTGSRVEKSDELFKCEAQILVLAANSNSVKKMHLHSHKFSLVVEGSNFGLVDEARLFLKEISIPVIPDIIASSSSAALVALQMSTGNGLSHDDLWKKIESTIKETTTKVVTESKHNGETLRETFFRLFEAPIRNKNDNAA